MIQLNVDFLSYKKIACEANKFLLIFGQGDVVPVPIEEIVEFGLKVDIVPVPGLQSIYDIDGATSSDLSTIYVDDFVYGNRPTRYRFTLAHEACHIFLHRDYFRQFNFYSVDEWKEFESQLDPGDHSKLEFQGYAFGGLVLVPQNHLKSAFEEKITEIHPLIDKAKGMGLSKETYLDAVIDRMASILAPIFDVSTGVMVRRIGYDKLEGLIP